MIIFNISNPHLAQLLRFDPTIACSRPPSPPLGWPLAWTRGGIELGTGHLGIWASGHMGFWASGHPSSSQHQISGSCWLSAPVTSVITDIWNSSAPRSMISRKLASNKEKSRRSSTLPPHQSHDHHHQQWSHHHPTFLGGDRQAV